MKIKTMKSKVHIILLLVFLPISAFPYTAWQRKIVNYERNQYNAGFQNWMISQSKDGWMYFANSNGLLEFDGVNWAVYPIKNKVMRSLKFIDEKIYIGGSTEFGYFENDSKGLLLYHSLSNMTNGWSGEVWNIIDDEKNIYFLSERHIHIYNKDKGGVITVDVDRKIDCSLLFKDVLYIGTTDGIFSLNMSNSLTYLSLSEPLKGQKFVSMLPLNNKMLITTARFGIYTIENGKLEKIRSAADNFIQSNQLFCASVAGTKIALGSVQNGIFIFDLQDPNYKEEFNLNNGLKNNTILSCFFDKDQNLWLGLDKGLSYINLNSPVRPLFATVSLIGTGYCSLVYNDELYLGTNQALYKVGKNGDYVLINGSEGQIWSMDIIDDRLFASGDNGIMVISPTEKYKIDLPGVWETHPLKADKNKLISGTYSGFYIIEKVNRRWQCSRKAPDFTDSNRGFIEDEDNYTFWIVNTNRDIQKVKYDPGFSKVLNKKTYPLPGSTFDANNIFRIIDNNLVICATDGIYRYSRITDTFERYTQLESMLEGPKYYEYLFIDKLKNIWYVTDRQLKMLPYKEGEYKKNTYNWGLSNELIDSYENVFLVDSTTAIVSIDNAFQKIDFSENYNSGSETNTYIRKLVTSKNDSIINYGKINSPVELPYTSNSVKIYFAATEYACSSDIHYTYRMKGVDNEWSVPSSNTVKEYTNLREGKYVFEVKAFINGEPASSSPATLSFTILPPWYRSIPAYCLYVLLGVILIFILYKKTISKQKKIIQQKGQELIAQTKRHEEETKLKDQEIYQLQNENLKTELRYKTQELNGHLLNIIRKNEMLEDVKKNALNISKAIDDEKHMNIIRQKVMGLIGQINSSIEHDTDFKVFQSNFDFIYHDFFKLLDERFPDLSRNDKILCAYLKMNLSSKEIAPLLNISVRGVEVNRYRLRKKMNIEREINLSEFLHELR